MRTKSTESMPFIFSFMMVLVSFLWLCYGIAVEDINIKVQIKCSNFIVGVNFFDINQFLK